MPTKGMQPRAAMGIFIASCLSLSAQAAVTVSTDRSLLINEIAVLNANNNFTLEKTLDQLAGQLSPGNVAFTGAGLFANFWDLQNSNCSTSVNSWEHACTRAKLDGRQSVNPELHMSLYKPIALINRIDLAQHAKFQNCGEYRVVYGRRASDPRVNDGSISENDGERTFINFEAVLPNPTPGQSSGCVAIQTFWANLSGVTDPLARSNALAAFYYTGVNVTVNGVTSTVGPVIAAKNFAGATDISGGRGGQIRTNQFLNNLDLGSPSTFAIGPWVLKEFRLKAQSPFVHQRAVGNSPPARLFDVTNTSTLASQFRDQFLGVNGESNANLNGLLQENINAIKLPVTDPVYSRLGQQAIKYDFSESYSSGLNNAIDVENSQLVDSAEIIDPVSGQNFLDQLTAKLQSMGRWSENGFNCPGTQFPNFRNANGELCFSAEQVVRRTMTQTCAGCHNPILLGLGLPGNIGPLQGFPASAAGNFVHINAVADSAGTHYVISPALRDQFLPARKAIMEGLLNGTL